MNLVSIKELSEFLKAKPATIYSWVHSGTISFVKLNGLLRFDMDEIITWIESSKIKPPKPHASFKKTVNLDIDAIVKRAVESTRKGRYNAGQRETGLSQGPFNRKED